MAKLLLASCAWGACLRHTGSCTISKLVKHVLLRAPSPAGHPWIHHNPQSQPYEYFLIVIPNNHHIRPPTCNLTDNISRSYIYYIFQPDVHCHLEILLTHANYSPISRLYSSIPSSRICRSIPDTTGDSSSIQCCALRQRHPDEMLTSHLQVKLRRGLLMLIPGHRILPWPSVSITPLPPSRRANNP